MNIREIMTIPGLIALSGKIDTMDHRHYALQIIFAKNLPFKTDVDGQAVQSRSIVIASDIQHAIKGDDCLTLFVEPECRLGWFLKREWLQQMPFVVPGETLIQKACEIIREQDLSVLMMRNLINAINPKGGSARRMDVRIEKLIRWIDHMEAREDWDEIHLFTEQIGIPWRRYLLWRKLLAAGRHVVDGYSLTESAHYASFSDSSHLSRVFKTMFGVPPGALVKNSRFIQVSEPISV
jgi:AraC-like DNA-binding protein